MGAPGESRTPNLLIRSQAGLNGVRSSVSAGRLRALCELSPVSEGLGPDPVVEAGRHYGIGIA